MSHNTSQSVSAAGNRVSPSTVGCFVLIASFFLPWITFLGKNVAGFEIRHIWEPGPYLWSIPIAAAIAAIQGLTGRNNVAAGQFSGVLPLGFLGLALYQFGSDVFKGVAVGGWLALGSGVFLLIGAPRVTPAGTAGDTPRAKEPSTSSHENQ